jgi:hypothetical protein
MIPIFMMDPHLCPGFSMKVVGPGGLGDGGLAPASNPMQLATANILNDG